MTGFVGYINWFIDVAPETPFGGAQHGNPEILCPWRLGKVGRGVCQLESSLAYIKTVRNQSRINSKMVWRVLLLKYLKGNLVGSPG